MKNEIKLRSLRGPSGGRRLRLIIAAVFATALAVTAWALLPAANSTGGSVALAATGNAPDSGKVPVNQSFMQTGQKLFNENCSTCHQQNGKGVPGAFPPLAGNSNLSDLALIVTTVHSGHQGRITVDGRTFDQTMPAIGAGFTAQEIAQVATYVRNSWGNEFGGVTVGSVRKILNPSSADPDSVKKEAVDPKLMKEGETLFRQNCATCHQASGKGLPGSFPPLADNPNLKSAELVVRTIKTGHSGKVTVNGKTFDSTMPAIGAQFSPEQVAAVATYVRNSWGNDFGGVSEEQAEKLLHSEESGK